MTQIYLPELFKVCTIPKSIWNQFGFSIEIELPTEY
jgi:hypothetical protein